jgi:glutamate/aspartate transport system substrate-binding protein
MNIKSLSKVSAAILGLSIGASAFAGATLDKITSTEAVNIGARANSIPYSKVTSSGSFEGYSNDICKIIIKDIQAKTGKTLAVTTQEVNGQTRQPLVLNGTTPLECGSTSYTEERAKVVNFMIVDADPVVPATLSSNTSITSLESFKGKKVSVVAGTTAEKIFRKLNAEQSWGTSIVLAKDYPLAFLQVEQGQTDAVVTNGVLLAGEMSKLANGKFKLLPKVVVGESELIGIMYGKNDPEFTAMVKATEARIKSDGTLERLYAKWFGPLGLKWTAEQKKLVFGK